MTTRLKDKRFWAMLLSAVAPVSTLYLNGEIDAGAAVTAVVSALVSGLLGVLQPQPVKRKSPLKIE